MELRLANTISAQKLKKLQAELSSPHGAASPALSQSASPTCTEALPQPSPQREHEDMQGELRGICEYLEV